jgi:hypothetical protein
MQATSISAWVVTPDALEPFRSAAPPQDPAPLPYLKGQRWNYDLQLEVDLVPEGGQVRLGGLIRRSSVLPEMVIRQGHGWAAAWPLGPTSLAGRNAAAGYPSAAYWGCPRLPRQVSLRAGQPSSAAARLACALIDALLSAACTLGHLRTASFCLHSGPRS